MLRKRLNKTQREMGQLLGTSLKAVHSYEQGWRSIPPHVERQLYFLLTRFNNKKSDASPCWKTTECPLDRRKDCPAWEFKTGDLCWFINGTICEGYAHKDWKEKMKYCRSCKVLRAHISG
jgi:hypothetical protein